MSHLSQPSKPSQPSAIHLNCHNRMINCCDSQLICHSCHNHICRIGHPCHNRQKLSQLSTVTSIYHSCLLSHPSQNCHSCLKCHNHLNCHKHPKCHNHLSCHNYHNRYSCLICHIHYRSNCHSHLKCHISHPSQLPQPFHLSCRSQLTHLSLPSHL